ncbi:MAG: type II toxin-antitoxin system prevent-host-death family antitoxin [Rhodobacteraceae bacterium]|nr:type II toxin-antitoxin system prevent-host-death family antitoxin [Paracoccaceae bacterium]
MRGFTATELANNTGDVLIAASRGAVEISRHGKPQFVLMTLKKFEQLNVRAKAPVKQQDSRLLDQPGRRPPEAAQPKPTPEPEATEPKETPAELANRNARDALDLMAALQAWESNE